MTWVDLILARSPWLRLLWLCGVVSSVEGHLLNMTRCELTVDAEAQRARGRLEIDLTRLIGDPETYYTLSAGELPAAKIEALEVSWQEALREGIEIQVDGEPVVWRLLSFKYPDLPLEKFTEPWAAPMCEVFFDLAFFDAAEVVVLKTHPGVPVESPFVLTMRDKAEPSRKQTRWLSPGQRSPAFLIAAASPGGESIEVEKASPAPWLGTFIGLGFIHILPRGWDHILFILGLFFLGESWRQKLLQVSCFTLAHTVSLGLSMWGWIPQLPDIVEPLIAASIVYVGVSNLRPGKRPAQLRHLMIIFPIGLLHGMGFAGVLVTYPIPSEAPLLALAAFNLGVELGQIAVLGLAFLFLRPFFKWKHYDFLIRAPINIAIAVLAAIWTVQRLAFF